MNIVSRPVQQELATLSGFGNEFATEALPGALPQGMNSPQKVPYGLYAEQFSGTAFTVPRHEARRTWLYRIRPSAGHGPFRPIDQACSRPPGVRRRPTGCAGTRCRSPRRRPISSPAWPPWRQSPGDALTGVRIHIYHANRSMERVFYGQRRGIAAGPAAGRLLLVPNAAGCWSRPGEIAVIPRGMKFRVELPDGIAARLYRGEPRRAVAAAGSRPDRRQWPRQPARLPVAHRLV